MREQGSSLSGERTVDSRAAKAQRAAPDGQLAPRQKLQMAKAAAAKLISSSQSLRRHASWLCRHEWKRRLVNGAALVVRSRMPTMIVRAGQKT